jgi:integral membrane protein
VNSIKQLRILAYLEGTSLIALVFVAVPMKHIFGEPGLAKILGPVHGGLFVLFLLNTMSVAIERKWKFTRTTWKLVLACFIPFGTFYIDRTVLKKLAHE